MSMADRAPARVIGVLARNTITVVLWHGVGLVDGGIVRELPLELVPMDLRLPNSEFDVVFDQGIAVRVDRKDRPGSGPGAQRQS